MNQSFRPGQLWLDLDGAPIQAHGGGIYYESGVYYWFGENKDTATRPDDQVGFNIEAVGVSCYSSTDLYNWRPHGLVLPAVGAPLDHDLHHSRVIERPKVVFNRRRSQYVMYLHVDRRDYGYARIGVAVSDSPIGPYTYLGSFAPHGTDSRDMTVFQEEGGQAYVFHASEWNATLYIGPLDAEGDLTAGPASRHFHQRYREAPAVFKRQGRYHLITSGCTGWDPNPAEWASADSILGPWTTHGNPCRGPDAEITFFAQSTFVLAVAGRRDAFIAMFDRWNKHDLRDSRYVWLPIRFDGTDLSIEWHDEWTLSVFDH